MSETKCPFKVGQMVTRKSDGLTGVVTATELHLPGDPWLVFCDDELTKILGYGDVEKWEETQATDADSDQSSPAGPGGGH